MGLLQRFVKNDAMKSDPPEIYGWRVFALATAGISSGKSLKNKQYIWLMHLLTIACFGAMIFGWDIGAIGGILTLPAFEEWVAFKN